MFKENFWFFVLPFFQNKHKKKQSRDRNDFFINDGKYLKQKKALHKFTFVSGGTKGYFLKSSKQQTY